MTSVESLLTLFVAVCAAGVALALVLPARQSPRVVAAAGSIAGLVLIGLGSVALFSGDAPALPLWTIPSIGAVVLHPDALSGLFVLVSGLVLAPACIFAASSLPSLPSRYSLRAYAVLHFGLCVSIVWILLAGDVFSFLVAWELMSVLSYLLVAFQHEHEEHRRAAYLMLAISEGGFLSATMGLLLAATHAGSLEFARIATAAAGMGDGLRVSIFLLTFFGFGVKAGLVPFNAWLPRAYGAAPAAFVPVLAGVTLNLGLYGLFRVNAVLVPPTSMAVGVVALVIGTVSALVGILFATPENDLKLVLAHSSIENAGIITTGFGAGFAFVAAGLPLLAAVAFLVALYHLVNHSLYKTLLFVACGIVDHATGTRDLDRLGGLVRRMPWTTAGVLAGVLSIAGLPPFNGFVSEWLTLQTLLRSAELPTTGIKIIFGICGAGLALTAALAVTCFAKVFAMGFLGMTRSPEADDARDAGASGLVPLAALGVLCLLLGVLPTYVITAIDRAVMPIAQSSAASALVPPFFAGSPGHETLPADFLKDFHDLGAQAGQGIAPGPGLVILHRGGAANPVVFAAAPTYLVLVLAALLAIAVGVVRGLLARRRTAIRRVCWDGGIRRLLPEMTYTATGFSNPVRVIFQAVYQPAIVEDTRETVAQHFRTAIRRQDGAVYIADRLILRPAARLATAVARGVAHMHHGRLNAYMAYALLSLIVALGALLWVG